MAIRRYQDFLGDPLPRPAYPMPERPPIGMEDYIALAAKGAGDAFSAYENSVAKRIERDLAEARLKDAQEKADQEKKARAGRETFRQDLINGRTEETKTPMPPMKQNGPMGPYEEKDSSFSPFLKEGGSSVAEKKRPLKADEMVDSYLKNVPIGDDTDAKGLMGLLIDKQKPAAAKMQEQVKVLYGDWLKEVEAAEKVKGSALTKDEKFGLANRVDNSGLLAKYIKDIVPEPTAFDERKQKGIEDQRDVTNKQADERIGLARQNYELSAGKDFRTDQQEYGKKLVDLNSVDTHLAPIEEKISSGNLDKLSRTVFSGDAGSAFQNLMGEDPALASEIGFLSSAFLKMRSGAAVNEAEAVRLIGGALGANIWSSKERFIAGVQAMRNEVEGNRDVLNESYDRIRDHYKATGKNPGSPAPVKKKSADDYLKDAGL